MNPEINQLRQQLAQVHQELNQTREKLEESRYNSEFLSKCAVELSEINTTDGIYAFTGHHLHELMGFEGFVTIVEYDIRNDQWEMVHIEGLSATLESLTSVFGFHPRKLKGKVNSEFLEQLKKGKLMDMGTNLEVLTNGSLKGKTAEMAARIVGLRSIHCITFQKEEHLFGNITLISNSKTKALQSDIIEQFVFLTSIFLEKQLFVGQLMKNQEELSDNRNLLDLIFRAAPDPITIIQADNGLCLNANPAFSLTTGWPLDEVIGKTAKDINIWENFDDRKVFVEKVKAEGEVQSFEATFRKRNQELFTGIISAKLTRYKGVDCMVTITRDISERKEFESKLMQAKEKAEESDRLKSTFLANLSHEIRTPMNGIIGFTELLQRNNLSDHDRSHFLGIISQSSERMLTLINELIDISIIESGQMKMHIHRVDLPELMQQLFYFYQNRVETKGLKFTLEMPQQEILPYLFTDNDKLTAILSNLLNNAIKFTANGRITFGYTVQGEEVLFWVEDTGIGMDAKTLEIIFDRFRQADSSLDRNYDGVGLGLSITRSYVEMLGGKIHVDSEVDKGSVFSFKIPIAYMNASEDTFLGSLPASPEEHKLKVLIVEDNEESAMLLKAIMESCNYDILFTVDGMEAVEICRNNRDIDLILMDIKIPGISGIEATRQIRTFNTHVKIIGQTAYAQQGDAEKILEAGCDGYISKPILKQALLSEIQKHFPQ